MDPHVDLGSLAVLAILQEGPNHPYEIAHQLRVRYREEMEGHNTRSLYRAVERLTRDGMIEVAETLREGRRPERTVYRITPEGSAHLRYQLTDLLSNPRHGPLAFDAALSRIGYLCEADAVSALGVRLGALEGMVAQHRAASRSLHERLGLPRLSILELEWKVEWTEAEATFVASTIAAIRNRELDVDRAWLESLSESGAELPSTEGLPPDRIPLALRTSDEGGRGGSASGQ